MGELDEFKDDVQQQAEESREEISDALDNLRDSATPNPDNDLTESAAQTASILTATGELVGAIGEAVEDTAQAVAEFEGFGEAVEEAGGEKAGPVGEYAAGVAGETLEIGAEAFLELGEGAAEVAAGVIGGIGDVAENAGRANEQLVQGEFEGVSDAMSDLAGASVAGTVDLGAVGAETSLEIASELVEGSYELASENLGLDEIVDHFTESNGEPGVAKDLEAAVDAEGWTDQGPPLEALYDSSTGICGGADGSAGSADPISEEGSAESDASNEGADSCGGAYSGSSGSSGSGGATPGAQADELSTGPDAPP